MGIARSFKLSKGQSLVEFAVIVPLLLLIITGTLQLGRLFYNRVALENAAREGAYYLSYHPEDRSNCVDGICFQGTLASIRSEANNMQVEIPAENVTINGHGLNVTTAISGGEMITVQVTSEPVDLFIFSLFNGPVSMSGTVSMVMQ